jgi:hypothetical protein
MNTKTYLSDLGYSDEQIESVRRVGPIILPDGLRASWDAKDQPDHQSQAETENEN